MPREEPQNDVEQVLQKWADNLDDETRAEVHEHFKHTLDAEDDNTPT
jgi:hypothetical protein